MHLVVPLLSAVISLVFYAILLERYLRRRRFHYLVWSAGLFLYFLGTGVEFIVGVFGLAEWAFRTWYLAGAILVPVVLALGTVYLLAPRKLGHLFLAAVMAVVVIAAVLVSSTDVDFTRPHSDEPGASSIQESVAEGGAMTGRAWTSNGPRQMVRVAIVAAFILIGGAIYSALQFARRRSPGYLVVANVLIAVGMLIPAIGGGVARELDMPNYLYLSELLGIIVIYLGFARASPTFELLPNRFGRRGSAA